METTSIIWFNIQRNIKEFQYFSKYISKSLQDVWASWRCISKKIVQRPNIRKLNNYMELFIIGLVLKNTKSFFCWIMWCGKNVSGIDISPPDFFINMVLLVKKYNRLLYKDRFMQEETSWHKFNYMTDRNLFGMINRLWQPWLHENIWICY